jgi:hypothetical protein
VTELFADFLEEHGICKDASPISTALDLAVAGVHVFPLVGKTPATRESPVFGPDTIHGVKDATDDIRQIVKWFWGKTANVGIAIGIGALENVRVLDVDPRNGGDVSLAELIAKHGALPETLTVESGRRDGGTHRYFLCPPGDYREKICGRDGGVDFLGVGKYVVGPTSIHPDTGLAYRVVSPPAVGIAAAPSWLARLARRVAHVPAPRAEPSSASDVERARRYLAKCEPAISGSGGHNHTFVIASKIVRGFALGEADAYALLADWNQTCVPPWSERDLRRKIREALRAGQLPDGFLRDARRPA